MRRCFLALALVGAAGCDVQVENRADVYPALKGPVSLAVRIPAIANTRAEFTLDGKALAPDTDSSDGYAVVLDTEAAGNGLHVLEVRVVDALGTEQARRSFTLRFAN